MRVEISRLHRELGTTIIYVTHDQVEAMTLADKIVVLKDGLIQQVGTPLSLYDDLCTQYQIPPKNLGMVRTPPLLGNASIFRPSVTATLPLLMPFVKQLSIRNMICKSI